MSKESKALADYAEDFKRQRSNELPASLGFSARLNMLWDLVGIAPAQNEGRVISLLSLNPDWRESDVRKWLQKDVLPPPLELHNMVTFLVGHLEGRQDARQWQAFLVYGSPTVASPVEHAIYREDQNRKNIATMIFALITERYNIAPSSYDAEEVFQRCLTFMARMNIYEERDFQPGHLEPFKNFLFPAD
ncbi:MAG: hypothetical protein AAGI11_13165 [Pseudomonadota bacterium]